MTAPYWRTVPIVAEGHLVELIDQAFSLDAPIIDGDAGPIIVPETALAEQYVHGEDLTAFAGPPAMVVTRRDGRTASVWPFELSPEGACS